jgi:hypothetical protein
MVRDFNVIFLVDVYTAMPCLFIFR